MGPNIYLNNHETKKFDKLLDISIISEYSRIEIDVEPSKIIKKSKNSKDLTLLITNVDEGDYMSEHIPTLLKLIDEHKNELIADINLDKFNLIITIHMYNNTPGYIEDYFGVFIT